MKFEWLTTQLAIVIVAAMGFVVVVFVGVPVWLVATGRAPAALLAAPIGSVLTGVAAAAVAWSRAIMKAPPGFALVSLAPPPPAEDLMGVYLPPDASAPAIAVPQLEDTGGHATPHDTPNARRFR